MKKKKDHASTLTRDDQDVWDAFVHDIDKKIQTQKSLQSENLDFQKKLQNLTETLASKSITRPTHLTPQKKAIFNQGLSRRAIRKLEPEAVIDLHGYTLVTAREVLKRFIQRQYNLGLRCLCVITGKGLRENEEKRFDALLAYESKGKRTIRDAFMTWLKEDDLHPLIASVSQANPHHGGGGAFYVILKSRGESF